MTSLGSNSNKIRKIVGNYELGRKIGQGRYGKVRMARNLKTNTTVALKVLDKRAIEDRADLNRIRRETEILCNLNHEHVVKLYEVFETHNHIVIAMEYAAGGDLHSYILSHDHARMDYQDALLLFRQMLSAVDYCHAHFVVHRDLKPENIFLTQDKRGVKIGDFGFARTFSPNDVLATSCGSLAYAAPEIIMGKKYLGPGADVWSLGCILYVMLCGRLPFDAPTDYEMIQRIKRGKFHESSFLRTEDTHSVIKRMLEPDPSKRAPLSEIMQHKGVWGDRPLFFRLLRPFARVFGRRPPMIPDIGNKPRTVRRSLSQTHVADTADHSTLPFNENHAYRVDTPDHLKLPPEKSTDNTAAETRPAKKVKVQRAKEADAPTPTLGELMQQQRQQQMQQRSQQEQKVVKHQNQGKQPPPETRVAQSLGALPPIQVEKVRRTLSDTALCCERKKFHSVLVNNVRGRNTHFAACPCRNCTPNIVG